jgi:hypothetical protein
MTKAELRKEYKEAREAYENGGMYTNEYALKLDTMLSGYFNLPLVSPDDWG